MIPLETWVRQTVTVFDISDNTAEPKLLSKAIEEIWGLRDPSAEENIPAVSSSLPFEDIPADDESKTKGKHSRGSIVADTDRIIKLLGAEVLYVKDMNGDNGTDDFGSADL